MTFRKGDPRINRNGRPPVGKTWRCVLKKICEEEIDLDGEKLTRMEAISRKLVEAAEGGDQWAVNALMDRIDGKPTQTVKSEDKPVFEANVNVLHKRIEDIKDAEIVDGD